MNINKTKISNTNAKATFYIVLSWGIITYLYILTNNIYNHDNILFTPNEFGEGIGTG